MLNFIKKIPGWVFGSFLIFGLFSCDAKNQETAFIVELNDQLGEANLAEIFSPYEMVTAKRSSRSTNQYTCIVIVKKSKHEDLLTAIRVKKGVLSIEPKRNEIDPPTNTTNTKMTKTKPIKS